MAYSKILIKSAEKITFNNYNLKVVPGYSEVIFITEKLI